MSRLRNEFSIDVVGIRQVKEACLFSCNPITSQGDVIKLLWEYMHDFDREVVVVINLKGDGSPINVHFASVGVLDGALVYPREILKSSILSNAAHIILVHVHPSGSLKPSKRDIEVTDRMIAACDLIGIPLEDHIIIGDSKEEYFSFREKEILKHDNVCYKNVLEEITFPSRVAE